VEPVVMAPLRREWAVVRQQVTALLEGRATKQKTRKAASLLRDFLGRLQSVTVLDPACGSGNFLYVTLQKLKDLEKEVIVFAAPHFGFLIGVGPWQLHGIELNKYAFELAQMTVWIGYLQWVRKNGFGHPQEPILRPMTTFECKDAVLDLQPDAVVVEPEWPAAEFIVSNPPFLGVRRLRDNLASEYVEGLFTLWNGRVSAEADYCCYWFEKARAQVEAGRTRRAGLLATQGIRFGANREVLHRIKETGDVFFAVSDREWILEGATVHVSMVGFDDGTEDHRVCDGLAVGSINSDLTTGVDVTTAKRLPANAGVSFMGDSKGGPFEVSADTALAWLHAPNPNGRPNSDVLRPWVNGQDINGRSKGMWIIDYPPGTERSPASHYEAPFEYLYRVVYPRRRENRRATYADRWWMHVEARPEMRRALAPLSRCLATTRHSKHRLFAWLSPEVLPDSALIAFAFEDDYTAGVLQSRVHEVWARATGSQLREAESGCRYTPTSTFETFPFPEPTEAQRHAVGEVARELEATRSCWLNPAEWTGQETLTFPASIDGPWRHMLEAPNADGIGTARYVRRVARDGTAGRELAKRTLTALYNAPPTWLRDFHAALDAAVLATYGLPADASDETILATLLELNLSRATEEGSA
jgi:hypothetical protein